MEAAAVARPTRGRRILVRVILGLATVLLVVAIFAIWANRQLLNPDNWASTSTRLLVNARVRAALSNYLVAQLYQNVDVSGEIASALPPRLKPLAGPLSGALRNAAIEAAQRTLSTAQVQAVWRAANRAAAQTLVAIVEGGKGPVATNNGKVTLDLRSAINSLSSQLGLPSIGDQLPPAAGELLILDSKEIKLVQKGGNALRSLALALTIIVPLLFVLAMVLAAGRRRTILMDIGFMFILAGVLVLLGRVLLIHGIVNSLVRVEANKPAAGDVVSIATTELKEIADACIVVGIPFVLAAWFAGPMKWAVAGRRLIAPFMREHPAWAFGTVTIVMALIFIWQPIPATGTLAGVIVFLVLAFLGTEVLRQQVIRESSPGGASSGGTPSAPASAA
ncbi:MAG TPA: hypothetical protein VGI87_09340 [Solirubrobacteraceae bacterium]|jgi:hypothetical protein